MAQMIFDKSDSEPGITPAHCAQKAAALLSRAGDAAPEYAQAFIAAARTWMDLGDMIRQNPGAWRSGGTQ